MQSMVSTAHSSHTARLEVVYSDSGPAEKICYIQELFGNPVTKMHPCKMLFEVRFLGGKSYTMMGGQDEDDAGAVIEF